jgi:hypothetical protein
VTRKSTRSRQLTIRFDPELAARLQRIARQDEISLNQAAVRLLRKAAGMQAPEAARPDSSWVQRYAGKWTAEEAEEFDRAVSTFERVDPEDWGMPAPKKSASARRRSR